jgi:hypothetical protein
MTNSQVPTRIVCKKHKIIFPLRLQLRRVEV